MCWATWGCKKQIGVRQGIQTGLQAEQSEKIPDPIIPLHVGWKRRLEIDRWLHTAV
jgi:hypothetical protein